MPENEQQIGQGSSEAKALYGVNALIQANKSHGEIDDASMLKLVEGLRAVADLPNAEFEGIVREQTGQEKTKRLA